MVELGLKFEVRRIVLVELPGVGRWIIDILLRIAVLIRLIKIGGERRAEDIVRLEQKRRLDASVMGVVEVEAGDGQVLCIAVMVELLTREAKRKVVVERNVHFGSFAKQIVGPEAGVSRGVELADLGLSGIDDDRAADRALAVERALRTPQHLHVLNVEQGLVEGDGVGDVDPIDELRDSRRGGQAVLRRLRADAADRHQVLETRGFGHLQARHDRVEIGDLVAERLVEGLARHRSDRVRLPLDVHPTPLGGDDHFLEARPGRRRGSGRGRRCFGVARMGHRACEYPDCKRAGRKHEAAPQLHRTAKHPRLSIANARPTAKIVERAARVSTV